MFCASRSHGEIKAKRTRPHPGGVTVEHPEPIYVGHSWFLHRVPQLMLLVAAGMFEFHSVGGGLLFGIPAAVAGLGLPWRFAVYIDGVDLWFSLGRRRTLAREHVRVRADGAGAVVFPRGSYRFGYPLTEGLVEDDRRLLGDVFRRYGFDVLS